MCERYGANAAMSSTPTAAASGIGRRMPSSATQDETRSTADGR